MSRLPLRFLACALFACLVPVATRAQMLLKPQSIRVEGTQQYSADEIGKAAEVKLKQTYTANLLGQTAQKLMATGMFAKVGFKFDGQDLVYLISDNPDLYPLVIDNLPLPPDKDVDAEMRAQVPLYRGKVPSEGAVLDQVRQALQSMLVQEGIQAAVVAVPGGDNPGKKATSMKFRIDTPPVRIGAITLNGIPADAEPHIPKPVLLSKEDYQQDRSAAELRRFYESALANLGYASATAHVRQNGTPQATADAITVPFTVDVSPGRMYKLGDVRIATDIPVTMGQLESKMSPRTTYSPENSYVSAVVGAVTLRLKAMGYLDCIVDAHPQLDDSSGIVNYTVGATTGPVYHLAFVKFDNVSDQLRSLLMRQWQMMPGDAFNEGYVSSFILSAQKNDPVLMRTLAGVKASYDVKADPQTHDVNLIIHLER